MKKLMLILAAVATVSTASFGQTPDNVKSTFSKKYPDATGVYWKNDKAKDSYTVSYTDASDVEHKICYDENGNVKHEKTKMAASAIPQSINSYYTTRTSPGEYPTVWEVRDSDGKIISYVADLNGKISYFDQNGKYTTRQMVTNEEDKPYDSKMPVDKYKDK